MSGGGLMQLIAYGAQDAYLTGNPQITFFKTMYRRYTNFAIESIQQTFNGSPGFGKKVNTIISRNGDLITDMFLEVKMPKIQKTSNYVYKWAEDVGYALLKVVELEIGGQQIDKHYSDWYKILKETTTPEAKLAGLNEMLGNYEPLLSTDEDKYMYIPLQFFFNRNIGLALPLIALQYHEVKVNIEFENLHRLLAYSTDGGSSYTAGLASGDSLEDGNDIICDLWVDYVFLDTEERRRYAQASHEYLIEQLQHTGPETWNTPTMKVRLNFNHPVKSLYWVMQDETTSGAVGEPFHYKDAMTGKFKLQLNGHDRFSPRPGSYFRLVQPYLRQTRTPHSPVYMYSFGVSPEQHQPSGTCNFSRIDTAMAHFLEKTDLQGVADGKVKIFATNYNVMRISSGMAGLAYAN